ncbi:hypothetical protein ACHAW5_006133 [Stephanodiscus triporus]|uniref:Plastid lipid-associated protein/fibrillin conserved domain-containing protein n=1 Tax=Stephanodiscus triporus TaxID=2934178 RepID=A0ABD3MD68_9STRA
MIISAKIYFIPITAAFSSVVNCQRCSSSFTLLPTAPGLSPKQSSSFVGSNVQKSIYNKRRRVLSRHASRLYSSSRDNDSLIKSLLGNNAVDDQDPYSRYTHQIAIPLQDSTELHSALQAIQTSLVRDCPRLIRACVMPSLLRMPLLYVDGSAWQNVNLGGGGNGSLDAILEQVVYKAIREVVYGDDIGATSSDASLIEIAKPILLPFRGLELQGEDNSVLYAVGNNVNDESIEKAKKKNSSYDDEDELYFVDDFLAAPVQTGGPSGWEILEKLVHNIQDELESKYGLQTCWPSDKPQGEEIEYGFSAIEQKPRKWRPRVPFVRLPSDFYQDLRADIEKRPDIPESESPSPIDMGFDGISPLFWYEAWGEDDILPPPGVRMRSVAVYRRVVPGGGEAETSFYVPTSSVGPQTWKSDANSAMGFVARLDDENTGISMQLPVGDTKLMARERREKAKAMERLGEVERREEREWEEGKARWMEEMSNQSLGGEKIGMESGDVSVEGDAAYSTPWSERDVDNTSRPTSDSRMIHQPQSSDSKTRRELPSIDDNPIFRRFRSGQPQVTSQGQNTALALDGTPPTPDAPIPPYPSDAHFVGAWRVVSSPLGAENESFDVTDSKSSDNFILRVDGQVMGGPILDTQRQHKAAGGVWKMFQAIRKPIGESTEFEEKRSSNSLTQTRLRIRLLVPPKKERVLVMEGEVTRLVMPGSVDAVSQSSDRLIMTNSGLVDDILQNIGGELIRPEAKNGEVLLYCAGEAWMEDVEGGANRRKVGPFALMKLKAVKRENLIYTVDVTKRDIHI